MDDKINEDLNKGGETWLTLTMERSARGLEVRVKTLPKFEDFIDSICSGQDPLHAYGGSWKASNGVDIMYLKTLSETLDESNYTLNAPCLPLVTIPQGKRNEVPNLSFLRFKGIGSPEGVKFVIAGPVSKQYVRNASRKILEASKQLIVDYIAPMTVALRISSQEL